MEKRIPLLGATLLALFASACGGSSGDPMGDAGNGDGDGGNGNDDGGGGSDGEGCGEAASIALGSWVEQSVAVAGEGDRAYFVRLPTGYDPDREYPVVYQLHGCSSNPDRESNNVPVENQTGTDAIHVRGRAADNCWDNTTDLPYFDAMVDDVEASFCTDTDRRMLTGYSSGAFFAHRIACVRGDQFLGVATIAGGSPGSNCVGEVAVLQIHDTNDNTVLIGNSGYPTRDFWVSANGCDDTTTDTDPEPCVAYDGCNVGTPVVWCETSQQDHSRQDSFAAPIFWDFLSSL